MSIVVQEDKRLFTLNTRNSSYQMQADRYGFLKHLYYGKILGEADMSYLYLDYDRGFSGNPDCARPRRDYSPDVFPQEYTGCGLCDYRVGSIGIVNGDGSYAAEFHYDGYELRPGKYSIPGQPSVYEEGEEARTLILYLHDPVTNVAIELLYGVFPEKDVITRAVRIRNRSEKAVTLTKAGSVCIDFPFWEFDTIGFSGKYAMERQAERAPAGHSIKTFRSRRGQSSHQQNPFLILCGQDTTEDSGECYGFMLMYSGNFCAEVEKDQFDSTRLVMGIEPENFRWTLGPGEVFDTPEVILSYSGQGLTKLSHQYHDIIRQNVCRGKYKLAERPVLLNSWEGSYFDFDDKSMLKLAEESAQLGVELLVMDDGWFGRRKDDNAGLGDWFVNEEKLKGGLAALAAKVNALGLKFGLWIEPEMVNEDSDLYRAHPEWALKIPGRNPCRSRNQLVLNMSRPEVRDAVFDSISKVLRSANIEYVKWDLNRNLADVYDEQLPADRQGEVSHRYILGVYELLERFTSSFPEILFEGCSGGGGRFDAAMLYYYPQIWCSDDTDPIARLAIQNGTSFGYPVSAIGAHVSASPNHQTGRTTPIHTRAVVAMNGTFGYELDPEKLTAEEKSKIRDQIRYFRRHSGLIQYGDYYRLTRMGQDSYEAWEHAARDGSQALLSLVVTNVQANAKLIHLRLKGLVPEGQYSMEVRADIDEKMLAVPDFPGGRQLSEFINRNEKTYSGAALMYGGITIPWIAGDYPAVQIWFRKV